jgi:hypothetical protein
MTDTDLKNKKVKPVLTIQIVKYCCTKCGEEAEELKICGECQSTMRVIEVVEKYGEEAEDYLKRIVIQSKRRELVMEGVVEDEKGLTAKDLDKIEGLVDEEIGISEEEMALLGSSVFSSEGGDNSEPKIIDNSISDILDEEEEDEDELDMLDGFKDDDGFPEL